MTVSQELREKQRRQRERIQNNIVRILWAMAAVTIVSLSAGGAVALSVRLNGFQVQPLWLTLLHALGWGVLGGGGFALMRVRIEIWETLDNSGENKSTNFGHSVFVFAIIGTVSMSSLGVSPGVFNNQVFHVDVLIVAVLCSAITGAFCVWMKLRDDR